MLTVYKDTLAEEGIVAPAGSDHAFFDLVVLPLLDDNGDGIITQNELLALQMITERFAREKDVPLPSDWPTILDTLFMGFDRALLQQQQAGDSTSAAASEGPAGAAALAAAEPAATAAATVAVSRAAVQELSEILKVIQTYRQLSAWCR